MSTLIEHAEREFELTGWDMSDEMNQLVVNDVMELIRVFSNQDHSGMSAPYVAGIFSRLATRQILGELTGADDEWVEGDIHSVAWKSLVGRPGVGDEPNILTEVAGCVACWQP